MIYMKELEQEPFNPERFVERLAKRTLVTMGRGEKEELDPIVLHDTFIQAISDLKMLQEKQFRKCARLEIECREEETNHWQDVGQLQDRNKAAMGMFQELDERINYVATKVIHLGDQLESVNTPRSRAVEAQKLMSYLAEFLSPNRVKSAIFADPSRIDEAADVIQKLYLISQELPSDKFQTAQTSISKEYYTIEKALISGFEMAHEIKDTARMKEIASILSHFKGYQQCVDAFIGKSHKDLLSSTNIFRDAIQLCRDNHSIVKVVFNNPDQVMAKLILNIYQHNLREEINTNFSNPLQSGEEHLVKLHDLYSRTLKLSDEFKAFDMGNDDMYLPKLTQSIFDKYLKNYIGKELRNMTEKYDKEMTEFYKKKGHTKRQIQTGGFHDLRRDIQGVIGTRVNINIAQIDDHGGETFLSTAVAKNILQTAKQAFRRCSVLAKISDRPDYAQCILELLLKQLIAGFVDYAVELGLQAVPIPETKVQPQLYFLQVVKQTNEIVLLLEEEIRQDLMPLVISTPNNGECLHKKKNSLEPIEMKLDVGLDRTLNAIVGWVKIYLQTEQKKTDFKPEAELNILTTPTCMAVVQYISSTIQTIRSCLDGKNAESVMMELGIRLHRVIYDHLQQFQFNSNGAIIALMDVNEYRKCVKELHVPLIDTLFDTLHALCNLLVVKPENLKQVCTGETLAGLDYSILSSFIQLRSDYKTQKLSNSLKGLTA